VSLVVRTVPIEGPDRLLDVLAEDGGVAWVRDGDGFVGCGQAVRIDAGAGPERFARAAEEFAVLADRAEIDDAVATPGSGLVAFGSFTFDARSSGSVLVVPEVTIGRRDGVTWMTIAGDADIVDQGREEPPAPLRPPDRVRYAGSSVPDHLWLDAVARALKRIDADEVAKVVLARDYAVWDREPFDPRVLARRLADQFPECFTFLCDRLIGATPELLIRRIGDTVESTVLAVSAPRGEEGSSDERIGAGLLASDKDRREHDLAVDSVRDVLARHCVSLAVDEEPHLLRLENVQHLETRLGGTLRSDMSALALAGELHPTAAVGGAPRDAAIEMIRELEGMDRGRYAGPVGWIDADGDGEWGIALRCAELSGARARLFAGGGIVAGSLPEAELEETRLKLRAMQSVLEG
jgi:menaquinone-specific isochorismate synthase